MISGGFNVYPKEVEDEIDAIEGVLESAVIGVPHPDFGEGVTAVVVPRPGAARHRSGDSCGARRPAGEIQDAEAGVRRGILPRNAMGKVQKAALREAYKDIYRALMTRRHDSPRSRRAGRATIGDQPAKQGEGNAPDSRKRERAGARALYPSRPEA